jgi:phosphoribosylformimino-5-aminoimidazole carboxamide ribotide isomerase
VAAVAPVVDLLPAIDVRSGRVVRLSQGEPTRQTVYGDDPLAVAERFVSEGARWIHLVDLDRAFASGDNLETIQRLVLRLGSRVRLQLGGGLRNAALIRSGLDLGVTRVVLGTVAAVDPDVVTRALDEWGPDRLAVGIDARAGYVAIRGWTETSGERAETLADRVATAGIQTVIYTDIDRDGMLGGPDLAGAATLRASGARVILSGGVATADDIRAACQAGLAGVIVGRALYEGRLTLPDALSAAHCSHSL